jgi:hypothetical protein
MSESNALSLDCRAKNKETDSQSFMQNTKTHIVKYDLAPLAVHSSLKQQSKILPSEVLHQNLHSEFQPKVYVQLGFQDLAQVLRSSFLARCADFKISTGDCMFDSIAHLLQKPSLSLRNERMCRGIKIRDCKRVRIGRLYQSAHRESIVSAS